MSINNIKIVSLFAGIGGFEEGLKQSKLKHNVIFESEIDLAAQKSYGANFGLNNMHGDITKINEKEIPNHDMLVAGFPCQSFSIAGDRKGFNDTRGTLFFDIVRVLKEKKPKYIFLENVKNLVSHDNSNTIKVIIRNLSKLGYTIDFTVIDAKETGVPQSRKRTYIVGIFNYKTEKFNEDKRSNKVSKLKFELENEKINSFNFFNNLTFNNELIFLEDIIEKNVDKKYYFNSEKVLNYLKKNNIHDSYKNNHEILKIFDLPRNVHNDLDRQRRVYSIKGISPTVLARTDSTKILIKVNGKEYIRKITPVENFYVQGFSKEFVNNIVRAGVSDGKLYKQSGNAVCPPVVTGIVNLLYKSYICKTKN